MPQSSPFSGLAKWPRRWLTLLVCLAIVAVGLGIFQYLVKTAPRAQRRPPQPVIPQVEVRLLHPVDHQVTVAAMGTVVPAREMVLKPRVSGAVASLHPGFGLGGLVAKGERLLQIDDQDFRLALERTRSQLVEAQYKLKVELGYQEVARREWELLNGGAPGAEEDVELALRKPHLAKARSELAAARAELKQAQLDLERTAVTAPFNAMVRATHVQVGSQVSGQVALADLVGTDTYWIRVAIPVDRLPWIEIPRPAGGAGAVATILYRGHRREGRVIRLLGDLETEGRMARLLVAVDDPLGLQTPANGHLPLLIGEYVRVEIQGRRLESVYRIDRTSLRDGDTVWLAGGDDKLEIREVAIAWRGNREVVIQDQLAAGDRLVVSDLAVAVPGMPLAVIPPDKSATPADDQPAKESPHG